MTMIRDRHECPWCGDPRTQTVNIEWTSDSVEETMICNHCEVQYTIGFGDMVLLSMIDEYGEELEVNE